jgi:HK97 family phage major capsid protein
MSKTLTQRNEVFQAMTKIMADASTEKRSLSADEATKYDGLEKQFNDLGAQYDREVRFENNKKSVTTAADQRVIVTKTDATEVEKRDAFLNYIRTGDVSEIRSFNEYSTAEGGATVPTIVSDKMQLSLAGLSVMRKIGANYISTKSPLSLPLVATAGTATWGSEAPSGSYTESDDAFGAVTLNAYKLQRIQKVSEELLNDSAVNIESVVNQQFAIAFANAEELAFVSGSGVAQPLGLLRTTAVAGVNVGTATVYTTSASLCDNMKDAKFAMPANYRQDAVWVIGDGLAKALAKAKDTTGQYLWQPSIVSGQPTSLRIEPIDNRRNR